MTDLRLLAVLAATWAGALAGLVSVRDRATPTAIALALLTAIVLAFGLRGRRAGAGALLAVILAVAATVGLLRADRADPAEVRELVAASGVLTVHVRIADDPVLRERTGFGGESTAATYRARVQLLEIGTAQRALHVRVPATMEWSPERGSWRIGQVIAVPALLHPDDLLRRSVYRVVPQGRMRLVVDAPRATRLAEHVRSSLARATGAMTAEGAVAADARAGATLLPGLVLGDTRAQSRELTDALRDSGLSHLTAVSGANVAIILGAFLQLLQRTRLRLRNRQLLGALVILAFLFVVRPEPSVLRATAMALVTLYALANGERRRADSVLFAASTVLLVIDPFLAVSWGFALSVAATAGLIVLQPVLRTRVSGRPRWLVDAALVTISAQVTTLPLLVAMGNPPTLVALPANLLAEPLVLPATVVGVIATLVAAVGAVQLAGIVALPALAAAQAIAIIAAAAANSRFAVAPITTLSALLLVMSGAGLLWWLRRRPRARDMVLVGMLLWALLGYRLEHRQWVPADWWYAQCDVGQGDATVVRVAETQAVVIDAGPEPAPIRRCLRELGVRAIPLLVFTHFHADHAGGLSGVLAAAPVGRVVGNGYHQPLLQFARVQAQLGDIPYRDITAGEILDVGALRLSFLQPPLAQQGQERNPNNASVAVQVQGPAGSALITGDLEPSGQAALLDMVTPVDVLKVPHHGSRYQDPDFLTTLAPRIASVSVGEGNDYGHPAVDTVRRLRSAGAVVLRTDRHGSIAVTARPAMAYATGMAG